MIYKYFFFIWTKNGKLQKKFGGRSNQNYSPQSLQKTIDDVKSKKLTYRDAAERYGVLKSTIQRKMIKKCMLKVGRSNALSMLTRKV
jgi:hypothetical protein